MILIFLFILGVRPWNHRGSNLLSLMTLLVLLAANFYDWEFYVLKMWSNSKEMLHILSQLCLIVLDSSIPIAIFISKLQSSFFRNEECLSWARTWNVGYLIRRMQLLDLSNKGNTLL